MCQLQLTPLSSLQPTLCFVSMYVCLTWRKQPDKASVTTGDLSFQQTGLSRRCGMWMGLVRSVVPSLGSSRQCGWVVQVVTVALHQMWLGSSLLQLHLTTEWTYVGILFWKHLLFLLLASQVLGVLKDEWNLAFVMRDLREKHSNCHIAWVIWLGGTERGLCLVPPRGGGISYS